MNTFAFTNKYFPDSSLVDGVYYNSPERRVAIDLDDYIYVYSNVPLDDVESLVNASSAGVHFNTVFKKKFGPGEYLGEYDDIEFERDKSTLVNKDFDSSPVDKDFNATGPSVHFEANDKPTKEFSLRTPDFVRSVPADADVTSTVFFTLDDGDKVYSFDSEADELDDAIEEVHQYVQRLGAKGRVVKVVFEFA